METDKIRQLMKIMQRIHKSNQTFKMETGIPQSEYAVMNAIACRSMAKGQEGLTITEISEAILISKPGVSQVVNALEERNYVKRATTKKDRRIVYVELTDEGQETLKKMREAINERILGILEKMGEEDSETLLKLLDKFSLIMSEV